MPPRLTCYGGVGEIGGNKILLEDKGTKVMLDFGTGFSDGSMYFGSGIEPRPVNGAGDLFEFGLLPELSGLYSEDALQNTGLKHTSPQVDAIVLSHFHWDHMGRIGYVDPEIPVYCGETTKLIHEAYSETGASPLDGHDVKTFRTGSKFSVGGLEFEPVHVDHSIPGAYGFVIHTSEGAVAYTGDFRFHGPAGSMTKDFVRLANEEKPEVLITEGTRVAPVEEKTGMSEGAVLKETRKAMDGSRKLVMSSFRGNDVDRINTFDKAARAAGRRLVVSMKTALILEKLAKDGGIHVPKVGTDVLAYVKRKRSGKLDDSDYRKWERQFLDSGTSAQEINADQRGTFLHLESWSFPELIDIKPARGGVYIHSSTEAFNEEGEQEEEVVKNWVDHIGFSYHQIHASGHAPMRHVRTVVEGVAARRVIPVHTEHPELFPQLLPRSRSTLTIPVIGKGISVLRPR